MRLINHFALLLMFAVTSVHGQSTAPIERQMSAAEFKSAGLDKLSPDELASLNAWLAGQTPVASAADGARQEDRRGLQQAEARDRSDIVSRIPGEFKGWRGTGEVITLENGQKWRITQVSGPLAVKVTDPTATVSPAALGTWSLRIEGYNARAKVKRIE